MHSHFLEAENKLGVWTYGHDELTPYQAAFLDGAPRVGLPVLETINDLDEDQGAAPETVNIHDGVRWNTSFAYLDEVRQGMNLTVCGDSLVEHITIDGSRASSVCVQTRGKQREIQTDYVILAAGAYGTPAILQRSGTGPHDLLHGFGIRTIVDSPVGRNLHDQAFIEIEFSGTERLAKEMRNFDREHGWAPDEQVLMKAQSDVADEAFDLHIFPWSPPAPTPTGRRWYLGGACLTPRSRGRLAIQSADAERQPLINNAFLSDPEGRDIAALRSLLTLLRQLGSVGPIGELVGEIGATSRCPDRRRSRRLFAAQCRSLLASSRYLQDGARH